MAEFLTPSANPADNEDLVGAVNNAVRALRVSLENMLPAKVVAYDRAAGRVTVQPMIQMITTDGDIIERAQVASIPVNSDGGGGFMINYNLVAGDLGWIKANDRDISLFLQTFDASQPNTFRMQDFSSAVFQPDAMTGYTIAEEDAGAMVIQSLDGTIKISLSPERIKVVHPTIVEIDTPMADFTGAIHAVGTITSDTEVTAKTINLTTHNHDGSPTAPAGPKSPTGAPVP